MQYDSRIYAVVDREAYLSEITSELPCLISLESVKLSSRSNCKIKYGITKKR